MDKTAFEAAQTQALAQVRDLLIKQALSVGKLKELAHNGLNARLLATNAPEAVFAPRLASASAAIGHGLTVGKTGLVDRGAFKAGIQQANKMTSMLKG